MSLTMATVYLTNLTSLSTAIKVLLIQQVGYGVSVRGYMAISNI